MSLKSVIKENGLLTGLFVGILSLWALSGYLVYNFADDYGRFGDMFGAVNALFSGMALCGVAYSIFLQIKDMDKQKEHMESQLTELKIQNIESTFFQRLEAHNRLISSLRDARDTDNYFKDMADQLRSKLKKPADAESQADEWIVDPALISQAYSAFYEENIGELGRYFRSVFYMLFFIDNVKDLAKGHSLEKTYFNHYVDIFRSGLSRDELALIIYNCIGNDENIGNEKIAREKMRGLIVSLNLFRHVDHNVIPLEHQEIHDVSDMLAGGQG